MILLALLLACLPPATETLRETVDVIEANIVYHETGESDTYSLAYKPTFCQLLFREWNDFTGTHEIIAWRMLKTFEVREEPFDPLTKTLMHPENRGDVWVLRWIDGDVERVITAKSFVATHTLGDPEIWERERFPKEDRRELRTK